MKESSFGSMFADSLESSYGGRVWKIADKSSLGLPDNGHFKDSIITFFETKIYDDRKLQLKNGKYTIEPAKAINDLRQFEVCHRFSRNCLVVYVIYCPTIKMTAVIPMSTLLAFIETPKNKSVLRYLDEGEYFGPGHGVNLLVKQMETRRKGIYEELSRKYGSRVS